MHNKTLKAGIAQISALRDDDLQLLMSCAKARQLKKGEAVLNEGEVCRCFYLVEKGYLRSWHDKHGVAINLNFTFEGNFTSNLKSYKNMQPSEFSIEAGEDATVWVFDLKEIPAAFRDNIELTIFIRRLAIQILLSAEEHSNLFKIYTPTERYQYIEKNKPELLQRVSLSQIASYLGVTRETLSRIRAKSH